MLSEKELFRFDFQASESVGNGTEILCSVWFPYYPLKKLRFYFPAHALGFSYEGEKILGS